MNKLTHLFPIMLSASALHAGVQTDILHSTQSYGAAKINASTVGAPLSIGGVTYEKGIGVHGTSEFPLTIPADASALTGAVGMNNPNGKAQFRILSGSEVLWTSPVMSGNDKAVSFDVPVPVGASRLYLQVDELEDKGYDHASWVNLDWKKGAQKVAAAKVFHGKDFGIVPNRPADMGPALRRALSALRAAPGSTLKLEKGEYHFWHQSALNRHYHASNHDQPTWQPVCVPLVDLKNVTIDAGGSLFLFHGKIQPMTIQDTEGLTIKGLALDYVIPPDSQGIVTKTTDSYYEMTVDPVKFPHKIENGWITFIGENWENDDANGGIVFSGKTGEIVAGTSDYGYRAELEIISHGHYRVKKNIAQDGIEPGDAITLRHGWDRPHPGCVLYRAKDTVLEDFVIHASQGMSLVAQRSENIHLKGGGVFPRKGTGRYFSAGADATHFSNCKGAIITENCLYEGMMDDAINVHATCLQVQEKVNDHTIKCKYMHGQAIGFETFMPGETLRFIQAKWLTPRSPNKVKTVEWVDKENVIITLEQPIPADLGKGDTIENADWFPSVHFKNNIVRNNRARGSLFTTPEKIIIENNTFETIAGSAILLAGDANGWFESGACHDIVIRNNVFKNNLTSRFQFTEGVIAIYPEVPDLKGQREYYHRNVKIENNTFDTFDVPLVFAISTDGLHFTNNTVTYNNDYKAWKRAPFRLLRCKDVNITGNKVTNSPFKWNKEEGLELHLTPKEEVTIK